MASLYNQIFNPDEGVNKLAIHGVYGTIIEYIDGKATTTHIKALMDGSADGEADIDSIANVLDNKTIEQRYQWAIRFHARLLLTELGQNSTKPIGYDEATFKTLMGY